MDYLVHPFLTVLFFLALTRLPAHPPLESGNTMEVLVLGRVGYVPAKGVYACFTRMGGAPPDLTLKYTATYTHSPSKTVATCNEYASPHASLPDGSVAYCLPPCPGLDITFPQPISVVITGHDTLTTDIHAALMESFIFSSVSPRVVEPGEGVVEVQWDARPGRTYRVQLWYYPHTAGPAPHTSIVGVVKGGKDGIKTRSAGNEETDEAMGNKLSHEGEIVERKEEISEKSVGGGLEENENDLRKDSCGVMSNATLTKVRRCYHDLDKEDDADDDEDDNDNDDDDNEEDNDDFIKFMRWRKCVALHAPCTVSTSASTTALLHTSEPLSCAAGVCVYYFTDTPATGSLAVEVMDVTDACVHSSHTPPTPVHEWGELTINTVAVMMSMGVDAEPSSKTMLFTMFAPSKGNEDGSAETGKDQDPDIPVYLDPGKVEYVKGDYEVVVINDHNHSEALKNVPAECDLQGDNGLCWVRGLQTLVDPEDRGPVSHMHLLLSDHSSGTSSLVSITDVQVRVHTEASGVAVVSWDREPSVQEFMVRVVDDNKVSSDTVTVACSKRGSDCLAIFSSLTSGHYQVEVTYTKNVEMTSSSQFFIENGVVSEEAPGNE